MGAASEVTFEVRDGKDWATFTTQTGDTTSDQVSRLKDRPEWALAAPKYDAWKADKKAQAEAKKADEAKTKDASQATAEATPAPEDDNGDDDDNGKAGTRRTLAKGYRK